MAFEVPPLDRWVWILRDGQYQGTAIVDYPFTFEVQVVETPEPCMYRLVTSVTVSGIRYNTEQRCDVFLPSLSAAKIHALVTEYGLIGEGVRKAQHTIKQVQWMIDHPPQDRKPKE